MSSHATHSESSCRGFSIDQLGNDRPVARVIATAIGQLKAVADIADEDRSCEWILHQLSAVRGELDRVRRDVLTTHLEHCLSEIDTERSEAIIRDVVVAVYGGSPPSRTDSARAQGRSLA